VTAPIVPCTHHVLVYCDCCERAVSRCCAILRSDPYHACTSRMGLTVAQHGSNSDFGWASGESPPATHDDDCGDAMDYLFPSMGDTSAGSMCSASTRDSDPTEDPADDRSFPFFLSASILRNQNEQFSIPERTHYPSHGMGPMSATMAGGRGGVAAAGGAQWQSALHHNAPRFSEMPRHQMMLGGAGIERGGMQQTMPSAGGVYHGQEQFKSGGLMRNGGAVAGGGGGVWLMGKECALGAHNGVHAESGMEGDMDLMPMPVHDMRASQAYAST